MAYIMGSKPTVWDGDCSLNKEIKNLAMSKRSKPTVWDGDLGSAGSTAKVLIICVLSPPCGMVMRSFMQKGWSKILALCLF